MSEGQAAWERFEVAYPRHRFQQVVPIQREFFRLWRLGELPSADSLLATLEAYKASDEWRQDEGKFVPSALKWLEGGAWKRPPEAAKRRGPYSRILRAPSPAEVEALGELNLPEPSADQAIRPPSGEEASR